MAAPLRMDDPSLYVHDPIMSRKDAAKYLGRSGKTLDRLNLTRDPMPGAGQRVEMGYRLSTLNAHLASLKTPTARRRRVKRA